MPVPFPILTDLPSPLVSLHFSGIQPTRPTHTVVNIPRPRMANDGHAPLPFRPSLLLATGKITSNFRRAKRSVVDKKFTSLFSKRGERGASEWNEWRSEHGLKNRIEGII